MRHQTKPVALYLALFTILLLALTACFGSGEEEAQTESPTPELAVVVFATEDALAETATPPPTATQNLQPTATQGATVGVGISGGNQPAGGNVQGTTNIVDYFTNRPPDINPLTGLKVDDPALLQRRPLMVRIGNDPGARPQVALNQADVVYEEIVEWWVTRFTAIYLSQEPETIAPIRSARLINLQLTPQYQGALANSGGSDGVRWELSQSDIVNLDEYFIPAPYFYRPNEGWQTRLAIDATAARDYLTDEDLDSNVTLRGFYFSDQPDLSAVPPGAIGDANVVEIPYPQQTSATRWEYDPASDKYLRFINDNPMLDADGTQVAAANVIIYFAEHQPTDIVEDSNGATSIRIIINGQGKAWALRNGKLAKGNWETNGQETPLFTFDDGQPMPFKPGNSWVQVVPPEFIIEVDGTAQALEGVALPEAEEESEPASAATPTPTPIGARSQATPQQNQ